MIERIPIESREQWLALRERNIGASEVSALLGVHSYLTPFGLWAIKSGMVTADIADNPAMRRGRLMEPVALQMLAEEHPEWTVEPNPIPGGAYYQDTELRLAATPDAFVTTPDRGRGLAQVKSVEPGVFRRDWQPNGDETEVPLGHAVQTICEAHLSGAQWACVVAHIVDHGIRIEVIDVPLHAPIIARIKAAAADFWRMVDEGREPPADYGRDAHVIEQLFSQPEEIEIDLSSDNSLPEVVAKYQSLSKSITELTADRITCRAEILHKLGNATAARIATGRLTAKSVKRKAYVVAESSYRTIRFKEDTP
jgi:predicted phage-related endonuclease